jgi:hypothetical protein
VDYETTIRSLDFYTTWLQQQGCDIQSLSRSDETWASSIATKDFFAMVTVLRNDVPTVKGWVSIVGGAARDLPNDPRIFQQVAGEVAANAKLVQAGTVTATTLWQTPTNPLNTDPNIGGTYINQMIMQTGFRARELGTSLTTAYGGRLIDGSPDDALHLYRP